MLEIKANELLKNHTTFRIGGPARYFVMVKNVEEMKEAIDWAKNKNSAWRAIGGGSNILFSDQGFDGLIIKMLSSEIIFSASGLECFAGVPLAKAMNDSLAQGLIGLEWASGIPGTIGGAVHNNAGAYGGEMAPSVSQVRILRGEEIIDLPAKDCGFSYRSSRFKTDGNQDIILSVTLKLKPAGAEELSAAKEKMQQNLADRLSKAAEGPSVGSTFRNIMLNQEEIAALKKKHPELPDQYVAWKKIPAAWLIEECGLKGKKIGGAMVSDRHAGKIINSGGATAEDVIMLISVVKQKVRSRFSLQLMEEVEYVGF